MGRVKLPIKKIENKTNCQVTFSKRRNGLIKKAYELSVLCDIDIALIMFSPSNRLSHFSGKKRIEDVISRYMYMPEHDRGCDIQHREYLLNTLRKLKSESEIDIKPPNPNLDQSIRSHIEELRHEVCNLQHQVRVVEDQIRLFEPDPQKFTSMGELESCEKNLLDIMARLEDRKKHLMSNHASTYIPTTVQETNQYHKVYIETENQGMASFQYNEMTNWFSENGLNPNWEILKSESACVNLNPNPSSNPLSNESSTAAMNVNGNMVGTYNVEDDQSLATSWHSFSAFPSNDLFSAFLPRHSSSHIKHEIEGPSLSSILQEQGAEPCQMLSAGEDSNHAAYDNLSQFNVD